MFYTTRYFEQMTESNLRTFSYTLEKAIITESKKINEWYSAAGDEFDIFLSHSYLDRKIIYGIYLELTRLGYSVYIDWLKDPELNRDEVSKESADKIRQRLFESKCLFYATTANSNHSNWMPWELRVMDGYNQKVVILPLIENHQDEFLRLEYLELYPYIEKGTIRGTEEKILWVFENKTYYTSFDNWLEGELLKAH